ncbi:N-acetyltransferase [Acutalibacter sp. 1XD8-33]|uniref:GNAT family N-acetyltransferase n=1 Tax=Acutalibacter sp. 1XD8-33 TaxID=2320081 RepID=UPI000EA115D0|nr:GNAT family protein [Acutalibacter sp. 1XD8-33]RKJ39463.1 N-acetyltransferase [Acutalibacter sp. 1XD8-33]
MLLKYKNLTIRNAVPADAPQLAVWWNNGELMAHAGFPLGTGETAAEIAARIAQGTDESRRLILELDGAPIGEMNYGPNDGSSAWIGVKICEIPQQERGYGKILLSMLIRWLFEVQGYHKITVDPDRENLRSRHVYERLGFQAVGLREDAWTDQLGAHRSYVDYELTPENFVDFAK